MPDPRRNCGPDDAIEPPILHSDTSDASSKDDDLLREDGRKWNELRPLYMKCGVITKAQGSVYMEMGETKLIAAIYGPREIIKREDFSLKGKVNCEFKYMPFSCRHYCELRPSFEEKIISKCIGEALEGVILLEKFPKAQVDITIQIIQDDGSSISLALTAASLALVDAKIEVKDLVVGCTVRCLPNDKMLVDPTIAEIYGPHGKYRTGTSLFMAILPSLSQITALKQYGKIEQSRTQDCIETCWESCLRLATGIKSILKSDIDEIG